MDPADATFVFQRSHRYSHDKAEHGRSWTSYLNRPYGPSRHGTRGRRLCAFLVQLEGDIRARVSNVRKPKGVTVLKQRWLMMFWSRVVDGGYVIN